MIINHNMNAMNAHRMMTGNTAASGKSMEKLSSGLRINRAGDDAAGLAISEKMRGQIRGLDQASRNGQDGISMIQTAEGALNETHSILQRMRELATQAASDTNATQDRSEIQKEINQLTSEINRIGNTTEFNTQKLLNGGEAKTSNLRYTVLRTGNPASGTAAGDVSSVNVATDSIAAGTIEKGTFTTLATSKLLADNGTVGSPLTEVKASSTGGTGSINKAELVEGRAATFVAGPTATTITTTTGADAKTATFKVDFSEAVKGIVDGDTIVIGGQTFTAKASGAVAGNHEFNIGATAGNTVDSLGDAIAADDVNFTTNTGTDLNVTKNGDGTLTFTADAADKQIDFGTLTTAAGTTTANVEAAITVNAKAASYAIELKSNFTAGDTIDIGGTTYTAGTDFAVGGDIATTTDNLQAKLVADFGASYNITQTGSGWGADDNSITITDKVAQVDANQADFTTNLAVTTAAAVKGEYKFEIATNFEAGQTIKIDNVTLTAGTDFAVGADINATATNLKNAITGNATLGAKFDAAILSATSGFGTDADTIVLTEKVASGDVMADVVSVTAGTQAAQKGEYSVELAKNFSRNDSITIAGNTYKAGTAADVLAGDADFEIGATTEASLDKLVTKLNADGTFAYTASKTANAFGQNTVLKLVEDSATATDLVTGDITVSKAAPQAGSFEFLVTKNFAEGDRIVIGGNALVAGDSGDFKVGATIADTVNNIKTAISNDAVLKNQYNVGGSTDKIVLTEKSASGTNLTNSDVDVSKNSVAGQFQFTMESLTAGAKINIDGTDLSVATGGTASQTATELKTLVENDSTLKNKYSVTVSGADVTITQKAGQESASSPTLSYTTATGSGFKALMQIGANTGQSMNIDVNDMRADALGVSSDARTNKTVVIDGKNYAVSWTASTTVTNGTDNVSSEFALDISTHDNATAAVKVIDDAINSVSSERSKLGAYQNRLEHTINNLGTASENLTSAESRIRDVDMAKEMMNFSKNNILSQAAQAMLAQANSQPQGVLQLLR